MAFLDDLTSLFKGKVLPKAQAALAPVTQAAGGFLDRIGNTFKQIPQPVQNLVQSYVPTSLPNAVYKLGANGNPFVGLANRATGGQVQHQYEGLVKGTVDPFIGLGASLLKKPSLSIPFVGSAPNLQTQRQGNVDLLKRIGLPNQASQLGGTALTGLSLLPVGGGEAESVAATAAKRFASKFTPEDVSLIGKVAEVVESGAGKANLGALGQDYQRLAEHVFGPQAAAWTTPKIKNAFDLVLQKIGTQPNKAGLGLAVNDIRQGASLPELPGNPEPLPFGEDVPVAAPGSIAQRAGDRTAIAQELSGGGNVLNRVKALPQELQNAFQTWVNSRRATDVQGQLAKQPFQALDAEGIGAIARFQSGDKTGEFGALKNYFDTKYQALKNAGLKLGYKQDYLPQLWADPASEVEAKLGKSLTTKPSFTLESLFKTYEEGISKGLTPRFTKVSDLVGWYESYANKALADRQFFTGLLKDGFLQPGSKAPPGWVTIDPDRFPKYLTRLPEGGRYAGVYKAPAEVAQVVNNYLGSGSELLAKTAATVGKAKNIVLSSGVPGTAINAHGVNVLARSALSDKNPVGAFLRGSYWLVNPSAAEKTVSQNLDRAAFWVKHGMSLSTEEHAFTKPAKQLSQNLVVRSGQKLLGVQEKLFENPLFQRVIPAMKIHLAEQVFGDLKKTLPEEQAARQAAHVVNDRLGGINTDELGRSKDFQNGLRTLILAPDWAETNIRTGISTAKGIVQGGPGRTFARNLTLAYMTANLTNKALSGHWMWQNTPGQEFSIDTGTKASDGKTRFVSPFGTAVDFARLPIEAAGGLLKGDPSVIGRQVRNRLSTPLGAAVSYITNTDYRGRQIFTPRQTPGQKLAAGAALVARVGLPTVAGSALDVAAGNAGPEEAIAQTLELPLRYSSPPKSGTTFAKAGTPTSGTGATGAAPRSGSDLLQSPAFQAALTQARSSSGGSGRRLPRITPAKLGKLTQSGRKVKGFRLPSVKTVKVSSLGRLKAPTSSGSKAVRSLSKTDFTRILKRFKRPVA